MSAVRVDISAEQPEPIVQWSSSKMKSMPRNWNKNVKEKSVISTLPLSKITETCGSMVNLTLSRMAKKKRPIKIVTVPFVLEDVAPTLDGFAAQEMNTVPLVKNTARKPTLPRN